MTEPNSEKPSGILMTRGVSLRLSNLHFELGPDGEFKGSPVTVSVLLNMSPFWLEIAMAHVVVAEQHHAALLAGRAEDVRVGAALEGEFVAGMQAIVAAAISLDALYATVKNNIDLPPDLTLAWRKNRTPRYAQLAEVTPAWLRAEASDGQGLASHAEGAVPLSRLGSTSGGNVYSTSQTS